jgi:glycosyltransferase involved in cell wall biosynthesis
MSGLSLPHRLWQLLPAERRRRFFATATAALAPHPDRTPPSAREGIAVLGALAESSGLGEAARSMHKAFESLGVSAGAYDTATRMTTLPPPGAPLLIHVNAPVLPAALLRQPRALLRGRRVIAYWAWELPRVPPTWRPALRFVHEIWTLSRFTADAIATLLPPGSPIQVRSVPFPVTMPRPSALRRADFGLPEDAVIVLTSFNLASSFARKNPLGAIAAFRQAFGDRRDRLLVLKAGHTEHYPTDLETLRAAIASSENIRLETRDFPAADNHALTACADIVLSPHRSEGFGLVPAEAMLLGRPVVATGWSGNMEFMDATSAALIDFSLVPATDPRGIYEADGAVWAEPDVTSAANHLVRLADDPAARAALAERGRIRAHACLSFDPVRQAVRSLGLEPRP